MIPAAVLRRVGYLDEQFPMFMNDVDLCYRIKQAGLPIVFFPEVSVIHHLGGSTRRVRPQMIVSSHRSIYRYFRKHHPSSVNLLLGGFLLLTALVRLCLEQLRP